MARWESGDFKNPDRVTWNLSKPPVTQEKPPVISFQAVVLTYFPLYLTSGLLNRFYTGPTRYDTRFM